MSNYLRRIQAGCLPDINPGLKVQVNGRGIVLGVLVGMMAAGGVQADGQVSTISTSLKPATPFSYTVDGIEYQWGMGSNQIMEGFGADGRSFEYAMSADRVEIQRRDIPGVASGLPCGIFVERLSDGDASRQYAADYPSDGSGTGNCDYSAMLSSRVLNRGAVDLFSNQLPDAKNIERLDYVFDYGVLAPIAPDMMGLAGHVAAEKRSNNAVKMAAILSLDILGQPASYGPLRLIGASGCSEPALCYGITDLQHQYSFLQNEFNEPQSFPVETERSFESVGMVFVSAAKLGLQPGQRYYGFSLFAVDVNAEQHDLLDPASFPTDTASNTIVPGDDADIYGGLSGYFVSDELSVTTGAVFNDINGNGTQDEDEAGISDIQITLYEDVNGNGIVDADVDAQLGDSIDTGMNGNFVLPGLSDGNYIVEMDEQDPDLPPGLINAPGTNPFPMTIAGGDSDPIYFPFIDPNGSGGGATGGNTDSGNGDGGVDGNTDSGNGDGGVDGNTDSGNGDGGVGGNTDSGNGDGGADGNTDSGNGDGGADGNTDSGNGDGGADGNTDSGNGDGGADGNTDSGNGDGGADGNTDSGNGDGGADGNTDSGNGDGGADGNTDSGNGDGGADGNTDSGNGDGGADGNTDSGNGDGGADGNTDSGNGDGGADGNTDSGNGDGGADGNTDSGNGDGGADGNTDSGNGDGTLDDGDTDSGNGGADGGTDPGNADGGADGGTDPGNADGGADGGTDPGNADGGADGGTDPGNADGGADGGTDSGNADGGTDSGNADGGTDPDIGDGGLSDGDPTDAVDDAFEVNQGRSGTFDVLANDVDGVGAGLTLISVSLSSNSIVTVVDNQVDYRPNYGFYGMDTFLYTMQDGSGAKFTGNVALDVIHYSDLNDNGRNDFDECDCTDLTLQTGVHGSGIGSLSLFGTWVLLMGLGIRRLRSRKVISSEQGVS